MREILILSYMCQIWVHVGDPLEKLSLQGHDVGCGGRAGCVTSGVGASGRWEERVLPHLDQFGPGPHTAGLGHVILLLVFMWCTYCVLGVVSQIFNVRRTQI